MAIADKIWHRWLKRPYCLETAIDNQVDGPAVILLHGLASSGNVWKDVAYFQGMEKYRTIAYDLLGFGNSPKPEWSSYDVEQHVRSLRASLRRTGVKLPVIIIGHSMGSLVALHFASRYPDMVKRLVLYEPPLFNDTPDFRLHVRRRRLYFSFFERIADSPNMVLTYARIMGRVASKVAGLTISEALWTPFERSLRNTIMNQVSYQELHDIQVSTDIVYGRFDFMVTQTEIRKMFAHNKHIKFHVVADFHGISKRSSRYLANLILGKSKTKKAKRRLAPIERARDNKKSK
jgi:pimeloyl-ACP methyl ester carboxylesterase